MNQEKIDQATLIAQQELTNYLDSIQKQIENKFIQVNYQITKLIMDNAIDGIIPDHVKPELITKINQIIDNIYQEQTINLNSWLQDVTKINPLSIPQDELFKVSNAAIQFTVGFIAADGLQLSDRLLRAENGARGLIGDAIKSAIMTGDSAIDAAMAFKLARELEGVNTYSLSQLLRIMRTELARAHSKAYELAAENTGAKGVRFMLSPRHRIIDICDTHAAANLHGLGRGVYPIGRSPFPAHPNTLSYLVAVY